MTSGFQRSQRCDCVLGVSATCCPLCELPGHGRADRCLMGSTWVLSVPTQEPTSLPCFPCCCHHVTCLGHPSVTLFKLNSIQPLRTYPVSLSLKQNRSPPAPCMWPSMAPPSQNQMARSRKSCSSRVKKPETIAFKCTNLHRKENAVTGADVGQEKRPVPSTPVQPRVPVPGHGTARCTSFQ